MKLIINKDSNATLIAESKSESLKLIEHYYGVANIQRKKRHTLTQEQRTILRELIKSGANPSDIAKKFGVTVGYIYSVKHEMNHRAL